MAEADRTLGVYLHLARASHRRRQPMIRDKLLVLAAVQAQEMGLEQIAALCRHRILAHNPQHIVGRWPTLGAALASEEFKSYLKQLRRRYSPEKTEHMLDSLGIELGREREAYFSDLEYAAALMHTKPDAIADILAHEPGAGAGGAESAGEGDGHPMRDIVGVPWTTERVLNLLILWGPILAGLLLLGAFSVLSCGRAR